MRHCFVLGVVLASLVVACGGGAPPPPDKVETAKTKEAWADSYLPLVAGSEYSYDSMTRGNPASTTLVVKAGGGKTAYFMEGDGQALIGSSFFRGVAEERTDGIYAVAIDNDATIASPPPLMKIISLPPKAGETLALQSPELDARAAAYAHVKRTIDDKITVVGPTKIEVPAGTFDAILVETRNHDNEVGKVWLAKGVGVVKWERTSGRVDQLTRFKIGK
ncbi:hypothetical protein BH09MYX1_BH09MYX1_54290 [soil metagenome]